MNSAIAPSVTGQDLPAGYPGYFAREHHLADGRSVLIRPILPEDESQEQAFFSGLSRASRRMRFQQWVGTLAEPPLHFFTHIDYGRHMAFVCLEKQTGRLVGEARYVANPDGRSCELGIVVSDDWHHTGIAQHLMDALIDAARARGFEKMEGLVLAENTGMLAFVGALGFEARRAPEDPATVRISKNLQ